MKQKLIVGLFIIGILFVGAGSAFAFKSYKCQYDNMMLYFTGQTKTEYGKLAKLYKCPSNHSYWIVE